MSLTSFQTDLYQLYESAREREHGFERLVGQNLWRLESFVKQVGEFASCRKPRLFLVVKSFAAPRSNDLSNS